MTFIDIDIRNFSNKQTARIAKTSYASFYLKPPFTDKQFVETFAENPINLFSETTPLNSS